MKKTYISFPIEFGLHISGTGSNQEKLQKLCNNIENVDLVSVYDKNNNIDRRNSTKESCLNLYKKVDDVVSKGEFPVVIGGDHSLAMGSIGAISKHHEDLTVIWIDAHGDMNTNETSITKNLHGMPLANLVGLGSDNDFINLGHDGVKLQKENVFLFGLRDVDELEKANVSLVNNYYMTGIRKVGFKAALFDMKNKIKTKHIHISFDIDSIDPLVAPAVSTPVASGFLEGEIFELFDVFFDNIVSMDIVEYNPSNDKNDKTFKFLKRVFEYLESK